LDASHLPDTSKPDLTNRESTVDLANIIFRLSGTIKLDGGSELPGVSIACYCKKQSRLGDRTFSSELREGLNKSDENGGFTFESLRPGTYVLRAFLSRDFAVKEITLSPQNPTAHVILTFKKRGLLLGEVMSSSGKPIYGAKVSIYLGKRCNPPPGVEVEFEVTLTTDQSGHYALHEVPPGDLRIRVEHKGMKVINLPHVLIAPGETKWVRSVLNPSATIRGKVVLSNSVISPENISEVFKSKHVEVALFLIQVSGENRVIRRKGPKPTGNGGSFHFDFDYSHDKAILFVRAPGFRPRRIPLDIQSGEEKELSVLLDERGGIIQGRIVFKNKTHRPEVTITFLAEDKLNMNLDIPLEIQPDAEGRFAVNALDFTRHIVRFRFRKGNRQGYVIREITPDQTGVEIPEPQLH
jgi:hypothetical protein